MVTTTIRPNGNAKVQTWLDASFAYIDEVVNQPDNGDDTECQANDADINETFEVSFPNTIDDVDEVTNITIWTLGRVITDAGEEPEIWLDLNGATGEQECGIPGGANEGWTSNSFDGSWNQANLDALILKYRHDGSGKVVACFIDVAYAVVTYSAVAVGWGHKFLGIPAANIGKISGVPIANIGKVKGIDI